MDRGSSLSGRFSLSMSNLSGTPVAESTHISQHHKKFPWGDGVLNSSEKFVQNEAFNKTITISKAGLRQKNDPRIFTDIQSKGLTSRIVKYGNSPRLSTSLSVNNLYNKPGQFPVVHLKKKEIPCNLNKKNLSMVRIAPPEKSVFQANTRSSILRTASIVSTVGIKKTGDEVSRENRPILHPAAENEIAPTRSVLDDLKEISRKRINSDVLDGSDSLKKYCKEPELPTTTTVVLQQNAISSPSIYAAVPSKRQREVPLSILGIQKSPEQLGIKRRMYSSSNNDITSSLSSSLSILSPKQKSHSTDTKISEREVLKSNSTLNLGRNSPLPLITPLQEQCKYNGEATRSISEPVILMQTYGKPKLTLFNKNYETVDQDSILEQKIAKEESSDICFVKPKANNSDTNNIGLSKNSLIVKAQKSKLALMLSGLSGDLKTNDEDDVDSVNKKDLKIENCDKSEFEKSYSGLVVSSSQSTLTFGTSTTVATKIISSPVTSNSSVIKLNEKLNLQELTANQKCISEDNLITKSTNIANTNMLNTSIQNTGTPSTEPDKVLTLSSNNLLPNTTLKTLIPSENKILNTNLIQTKSSSDISKNFLTQQNDAQKILPSISPLIANVNADKHISNSLNFNLTNATNAFNTNSTKTNEFNKVLSGTTAKSGTISNVKNLSFNINNLPNKKVPQESLFTFGVNSADKPFAEPVLQLNTQVGENTKSFSFGDKKMIAPTLNFNSKAEISGTSMFGFAKNFNNTNTNQQPILMKNNEEIAETFTPFSFKSNNSENSIVKSSTTDKPFSFGSNLNSSFNFSSSVDKNPSNENILKPNLFNAVSESTAIPNLFNSGSSAVPNERLIRKATRRLHK